MQEPRSTSTLELVVNEQQLQNMSQIDLSQPSQYNRPFGEQRDNSGQPQPRLQQQQQQPNSNESFGLQQLKGWPARFRNSFNAKLDEARSKSETNTEFVFNLFGSFSGIVIWFVCFLYTTLVPVFLFLIGLFNLDNCSDRPSLPYLIFAIGFVMTASNLFNLALALDLPILSNNDLTNDIKNTIASIINIIFNCTVAFLYILCSYMVYTIGISKQHQDNINKNLSATNEPTQDGVETSQIMDCNGLLYYSSFWFVTLTLSVVAIFSLTACILFAYNKYRLAMISGLTPRPQSTPTVPTS